MLFPQNNISRSALDLSGIWRFKADRDQIGIQNRWETDLKDSISIAVPGSWNEQIPELRDYLGWCWYQTSLELPFKLNSNALYIRFASVNYKSIIWINGVKIGEHEGGHLPFEFEISKQILDIRNGFLKIVVLVENNLKPERVPPGNCSGWQAGNSKMYPDANYDFFPYCGIQRQVWLLVKPKIHIKDIWIQTSFENNQSTGVAEITVNIKNESNVPFFCAVSIENVVKKVPFVDGKVEIELKVDSVTPWCPETPKLYDLKVEILKPDEELVDKYIETFGFRTVEVKEEKLLLNGKPIFLRGFGKHEDFAISGRGLNLPVLIRDNELLKWIGANSFRTSHYPYSEESLQLADREGFLVIDETPAVGLFFDDSSENLSRREHICSEQVESLIKRDKNHPCVIIWSLANEPCPSTYPKDFSSLETQSTNQTDESLTQTHKTKDKGYQFLSKLRNKTKSLDSSRPIIIVNLLGAPKYWFDLSDIAVITRYWGWYVKPGQIKEGVDILNKELDTLYKSIKKPIFIAEFGADTISGCHSIESEMFSEEYQTQFIRAYLDLGNSKEYIIGMHIWNFADFKTCQGIIRIGGLNHKGVFTRDRKPKMVAHYLKQRWKHSTKG